MSRSKDSAGFGNGGRRVWRDCSGLRRCPVCGADSWCQYHAHEPVVLCKRVSSQHRRVNVEGVEFFVHRMDGAAFTPEPIAPVAPDVATAEASVLDAAYRAVLGALSLDAAHWSALKARGLTDQKIYANTYRTLPLDGRSKLARAILEAVGHVAAGVPGYYVASGEGRTWASFAGAPGIVVPVRDVEGCIVALKIRRDGDGDGPRYTYVSSAKRGGASAVTAVHVPQWREATDVVRVTEGELKADVCTALSGRLTVSVPGVGLWRGVLPVLHALGARKVRVAFDADCRTNPRVAEALRGLCTALRGEGFEVRVESWDAAEAKGLDDLLVKRTRAA